MVIQINVQQAALFKGYFEAPAMEEERNYKWAVHLFISRLLSDEHLNSDDFPTRLSSLMRGKLDPADLGLSTGCPISDSRRVVNGKEMMYNIVTVFFLEVMAHEVIQRLRSKQDISLAPIAERVCT